MSDHAQQTYLHTTTAGWSSALVGYIRKHWRYIVMMLTVTGIGILAAILQVFLLPSTRAQSTTDGNFTPGNTAFSPPVYPAPIGLGTGAWATAYTKAQAIVSQMTLLEKINLTTGTGWLSQQCVGNTGSVPRLGIPSFCLQDSPTGVRLTDYNTAFMAGVTIASTWDKGAIYQRGYMMGQEFKGKGVNIGLLPVCGPLGKNPQGGRNWEGFSPDPYLAGWAMRQTVQGLQDAGIIATAKHYILNEQEHFRQPGSTEGYPDLPAITSNIDDRTMHEIYLWPFAEAVRAGVGSIMCSYQQVNNSYSCQNSKILNGLLKDELGFPGFVMSDWGAQLTGTASALAGLDMTMPGGAFLGIGSLSYWGPNLTLAVLNGTIPLSRVNDMVTRIMAAYYYVGQDQGYPPVSFSSWTLATYGNKYFAANEGYGLINQHIDVRGNHGDVARGLAADSIVLLKNVNNTLPLRNQKQIGVFGSDAGPGIGGPNQFSDRGGTSGTLAVGWGSGTVQFPYLITPLEALQWRARQDGSAFQWVLDDFDYPLIALTAAQATVCFAFVKSDSGEGYISVDGNIGDRNNLTAWEQGDQLITTVAGSCSNTIVVVHSVGQINMEAWADHPNVTAILWASLPGQESGDSLADVIYGDVNPSGRLPFTIARNDSDYSSSVLFVPNDGNSSAPYDDFSEGLLVDYRAFDAKNITPRYEFGFGLSYTTFNYSNLVVTSLGSIPYAPRPSPPPTPPEPVQPSNETYTVPTGFALLPGFIYPYITATPTSTTTPSPVSTPFPYSPAGGGPGGNPSLWDVLYTADVTITNIGSLAGREVVQLYVSYPESVGEPPRQLRGFEKVSLDPGQSTAVRFDLLRKDLSYWDVVSQNWVIANGTYIVYVGSSSRNLLVQQELVIGS